MKKEFLLNNKLTEEDFFNKVYKNNIIFTPKNYIYTLPREDSVLEEITNTIHFTTIKPYVLQRFKIKELARKGIKEYFFYLQDFIDLKYKFRFKLMKIYVFYCGGITFYLERKIRYFWNKYILKKKDFYFKSNLWTHKIYKYSFIKKYQSKGELFYKLKILFC